MSAANPNGSNQSRNDLGGSEQNALWDSRLGQRLIEQESSLLHPVLRGLYGESVLWIGEQTSMSQSLGRCMVRLPIHASCLNSPKGRPEMRDITRLQVCSGSLPFASASLDGVVLHHALESAPDARACIREVERVLKPGGRLVICAFNPISLSGLRAWSARSSANPLWGQKFISPTRLLDWLALLNLQQVKKPEYRSITAPLIGPSLATLGRRMAQWPMVNSLKASAKPLWGFELLAPTLASAKRLIDQVIKRLPIGGIVIVSACKTRQGGTLVGRESTRTKPGPGKLVLAPTARVNLKRTEH